MSCSRTTTCSVNKNLFIYSIIVKIIFAVEDVIQETQSPELRVNNTTNTALTKFKLVEPRILYNGYQLWKTYIENDKSTKILEQLREKEG